MNKSQRKVLFLLPILVISLAMVWKSWRSKPKEEIHYHAGFIVYVNGVKQDFSDGKYMNVEPCAVPGHEVKEDDQLEKAHLHDFIGNVVHVHRNSAKWSDLFANIHYTLPDSVQGYVNGTLVENILNKPITPYESVLFVAGTPQGVDVNETIPREHIVEIEGKSETCGSENI